MEYHKHGTNCEEDEVTTRTWELDGNKLTVVNPDPIVVGPNVWTVTITAQELIFKIQYATPIGKETDIYYYTRN